MTVADGQYPVHAFRREPSVEVRNVVQVSQLRLARGGSRDGTSRGPSVRAASRRCGLRALPGEASLTHALHGTALQSSEIEVPSVAGEAARLHHAGQKHTFAVEALLLLEMVMQGYSPIGRALAPRPNGRGSWTTGCLRRHLRLRLRHQRRLQSRRLRCWRQLPCSACGILAAVRLLALSAGHGLGLSVLSRDRRLQGRCLALWLQRLLVATLQLGQHLGRTQPAATRRTTADPGSCWRLGTTPLFGRRRLRPVHIRRPLLPNNAIIRRLPVDAAQTPRRRRRRPRT
mmetsp:Transcript_47086/g.131340  ORF Transcript_47086/g.131340 Transcript_47086/m.131340 type:complete len:287 (-) Transcript_47086:1297-2157(-)